MANLNSSLYRLTGGSATNASDASPMYFALALSDSKDGYVTIQIDDETMMSVFLEEDEVEANPIESEESSLDNYYDELADTDDTLDDEEDNDSDVDNNNSSDEVDEEG